MSIAAPKVSVLVITYNHEKFISQAIESILTQQVNFDYEIVIGEDCSLDNTREIIIKYKKKYPDKFRLLLHPKNLGQYGKLNLVKTLEACQGQYVALLEGDDYWLSPDKLQKQVDFLENHPEHVLCYHNVLIRYEDDNQPARKYYSQKLKESQTLEDLLVANIPTCSVMFRNRLFNKFPEWFYELIMSDWLLNILNAQYGKIGYIDEVMGVYRTHQTGVWAMQSHSRNLQEILRAYDYINAHFNYKFDSLIRRLKFEYRYQLVLEFERNGDLDHAKSVLAQCIRTVPFISSKPSAYKILIKTFFRLYAPFFYRLFKSLYFRWSPF